MMLVMSALSQRLFKTLFLLFLPGSWRWQFRRGHRQQIRQPLAVLYLIFYQERVLRPGVGWCFNDITDEFPARSGRFDEQLVVADKCHDLAVQVKRATTEHHPVRQVAAVVDLISDELYKLQPLCHSRSPVLWSRLPIMTPKPPGSRNTNGVPHSGQNPRFAHSDEL